MSLIVNDYLTPHELADIKEVDVRTIYNWIRRGIAPPYEKERGMYWFRKAEAVAFQKPRRGPARKRP
jgi:predicted site-specific integrase-resolvase